MKKNTIFLSLCLTFMLASCTSTQITSSWREPNKQISLAKLNKVLVVALFKTETSRHKAEDEMVSYLKNKGVASYNYLDESYNKKSESEIRDKVKLGGFDGAITMRLIDVNKEETYIPGNSNYPEYYRSFTGYYYRNWSYYSDPGYYYTTKKFTVETNVYSLKADKIIWSGITRTTDPEGVDQMMNEITKVVYKKMIKEGFITK
jgi:hypothetical protein